MIPVYPGSERNEAPEPKFTAETLRRGGSAENFEISGSNRRTAFANERLSAIPPRPRVSAVNLEAARTGLTRFILPCEDENSTGKGGGPATWKVTYDRERWPTAEVAALT